MFHIVIKCYTWCNWYQLLGKATKRAFIFLEPFPYNCYQLLQLVQLVQSWCAASGVGLDLCHCYQRRPGL